MNEAEISARYGEMGEFDGPLKPAVIMHGIKS